ncbi:MAG: alpha/beta fold hydrolase [Gammaproteobacteria bacterium]|nr:alpha/beta fold hydrolase [Gammaproteobacteria bacterium]
MIGYFDLNQQTYDRCVRVFDRAKNLLGVRIMMHHDGGQLEHGDIFLFNHFARAETFIPQYCIYRETSALCRSIAAGEFFTGNDRFANLLRDVGAVPNDHPELMLLLAIDILKGRKIIIFPEGGMVKDRQVVDDRGEYSVYSRSADARRKHHSGAARLAVGLQIFKQAVLHKDRRKKHGDLERWAEQLGLPSAAILLERARRPVTIVPANITFYPLRVEDNFLRRGADLVLGALSPRAIEELIVEGNLFFKATDMDIRCGEPIRLSEHWEWWERLIAGYMARGMPDLNAIFEHEYLQENPVRKIASKGLQSSIGGLRDRYMHGIYREVTVNLSHLAASAIMQLIAGGRREFSRSEFARILYLALKRLQPHTEVHLHRSLINPTVYRTLLEGESADLQEFLAAAAAAQLISIEGTRVRCLDKLLVKTSFDQVRIENPLEVYANEVEPMPEVAAAVTGAIAAQGQCTAQDLAAFSFADALQALDWDRRMFTKDKHREINAQETATADPTPFLLHAAKPALGVLLVHGFLASPAEVRPFGEKLHAAGYTVLGVRLKGHGTSPWDLRERSWRDWFQSVANGYEILHAYCEKICIIGFSTGGALTLIQAAACAPSLAGIVAVAPPLKFQNRNMRYVPLVHGANQLIEWVSNHEGVVPFRPTDSEHPQINYRHMPIRGLYELTRMVAHVKKILPNIACPALVIQGTKDQVVDPQSASLVVDHLGSREKHLVWIDSNRHGILYEDVDKTHATVFEFLARLSASDEHRP